MKLPRHHARALTLLELLLVVFLLAAVAASAASLADNADLQARHELTKSRREQVREAILGPRQTVNGQPLTSGFVADMGRLPTSLRELVEPVGGLSPWGFDPAPTLRGVGRGWRGPYLTPDLELAPPEQPDREGHAPLVRDGWGNVGLLGDDNFGWRYDLDFLSNAGDLGLRSVGRNGREGSSTPGDPYAADFPVFPDLAGPSPLPPYRHLLLVRAEDWQFRGTIEVDLTGVAEPPDQLCLCAVVPTLLADNWRDDWSDPATDTFKSERGVATSSGRASFVFSGTAYVPAGFRVFAVVRADGTEAGRTHPTVVVPNSPVGPLTLQ